MRDYSRCTGSQDVEDTMFALISGFCKAVDRPRQAARPEINEMMSIQLGGHKAEKLQIVSHWSGYTT